VTSGPKALAAFRRSLLAARPELDRQLPWSQTSDPWAILVSEFMLQQTQVSRVLPRYEAFLDAFPTPSACAAVPLSRVLLLWQGLGFTRRAKNLHDSARLIHEKFDGRVPATLAELRELPGVGAYTAAAVASFAFGVEAAALDTNVGRVLARALANERLTTKAAEALADDVLDRDDPGQWNQLMIDLGAQFCRATPRCDDCPVRRRCAWRQAGGHDPALRSAGVSTPQSTFAGSLRQQRGAVLRHLGAGPRTAKALAGAEGIDPERLDGVLDDLQRDGLIERVARTFRLSER